MRLANGTFLIYSWLLLVLGMILIYSLLQQQKALQKLATTEILRQILPRFRPQLRRWQAVVGFSAMVLLFFAFLRPQWGFQWMQVRDRGSDLFVLVDVSDSMRATDFQPTRLERARREIVDLLKVLQGERIGLVAFAGESHILCPLTHDLESFSIFLDYLNTDLIPVQGTNLGSAIETAVAGFEPQSPRQKSILLITDGEDHQQKLQSALKKANDAEVKIFVVGIGSPTGAPIPTANGSGFRKDQQGNVILTRLNETVLREIATQTDGGYVRSVAGDLDLQQVYEQGIGRRFGDSDLRQERRKQYYERYQIFLLGAILLFLLQQGMVARTPAKKQLAALLLLTPLLAPQSLIAGPLSQGTEAYNNQQYAEALQNFARGQVDDPDNAAIHFNSGNAYYRLGKFSEAAEAFSRASNTQDPFLKQEAFYNRGNALFRQQRYQEAIDSYEQALKLAADDREAKHNLELAKKLLEQQQKQPQNNQQEQNEESEPSSQQQPKPEDSPEQRQQQQGLDQQTRDRPDESSRDAAEKQPDTEKEFAAEEAKQWLATVEEDGREALKKALQLKMWKKRTPTEDW